MKTNIKGRMAKSHHNGDLGRGKSATAKARHRRAIKRSVDWDFEEIPHAGRIEDFMRRARYANDYFDRASRR